MDSASVSDVFLWLRAWSVYLLACFCRYLFVDTVVQPGGWLDGVNSTFRFQIDDYG